MQRAPITPHLPCLSCSSSSALDVHVGLELGHLIQKTRLSQKMSQKDLAAVSACRHELSTLTLPLTSFLPPTPATPISPSLTPLLPLSLTPSLPYSLPPLLPPSLTPSLPYSLPPLLSPSLPQRINEKVVVVVDYESGRALPNPQIISKLERALGGSC